ADWSRNERLNSSRCHTHRSQLHAIEIECPVDAATEALRPRAHQFTCLDVEDPRVEINRDAPGHAAVRRPHGADHAPKPVELQCGRTDLAFLADRCGGGGDIREPENRTTRLDLEGSER